MHNSKLKIIVIVILAMMISCKKKTEQEQIIYQCIILFRENTICNLSLIVFVLYRPPLKQLFAQVFALNRFVANHNN